VEATVGVLVASDTSVELPPGGTLRVLNETASVAGLPLQVTSGSPPVTVSLGPGEGHTLQYARLAVPRTYALLATCGRSVLPRVAVTVQGDPGLDGEPTVLPSPDPSAGTPSSSTGTGSGAKASRAGDRRATAAPGRSARRSSAAATASTTGRATGSPGTAPTTVPTDLAAARSAAAVPIGDASGDILARAVSGAPRGGSGVLVLVATLLLASVAGAAVRTVLRWGVPR